MRENTKEYQFRTEAVKKKEVKIINNIISNYCDYNELSEKDLKSSFRDAYLVTHRKALLLILKDKGYTEATIGYCLDRHRTTLIKQYANLKHLKKLDERFGTNSKEFRLAEEYEKNIQRSPELLYAGWQSI